MAVTGDQYAVAAIFAGTFALVYLLVNRASRRRTNSGNEKCPPSIRSLPVVGSLPFLPRITSVHSFFAEKSHDLGDVISLTIGSKYVVVLNSHEVIREAFVKRATAFADRPMRLIHTYINPNCKGIINHPYNADFKRYHQLSLSILKEFGFGQSIMETKIDAEVKQLIRKIKETKGHDLDPKELVTESILNVISSIVFGQRLDTDKQLQKVSLDLANQVIEEGLKLLALDIVPIARFLPSYRRILKESINVQEHFFNVVSKKTDEYVQSGGTQNFIMRYIEREGADLDREQLQHTIRDFIVAGTETSATTVLWALALLADHPDVERRLQEEIDSVVPRDRLPSLDDKQRLPYVEAAVLELMRFKTLLPLGLSHAALCDTEVGGYFIPKGTFIFANLYAAQMSERVWVRPQEFRPERFLDETGGVVNKDLMISFSMGKRSCLGELLARQEVYLFITGLVQQFHIRPPEGVERIDAKDQLAGTLAPSPYQVRLIARDMASD